ncbi:hypothetical protein CcCBS67573_g02219 [Chytriomyces confervae]|uniref:Cyclic nucleotide-binding domain-containing protein n=1 Tax=Chytriomyces confervae TaxID=246404 RepID=A0A507FNA1_9FUNG|nr:hypothetical protein CcCBS67573_g02219 [Chytriomyces confervae]
MAANSPPPTTRTSLDARPSIYAGFLPRVSISCLEPEHTSKTDVSTKCSSIDSLAASATVPSGLSSLKNSSLKLPHIPPTKRAPKANHRLSGNFVPSLPHIKGAHTIDRNSKRVSIKRMSVTVNSSTMHHFEAMETKRRATERWKGAITQVLRRLRAARSIGYVNKHFFNPVAVHASSSATDTATMRQLRFDPEMYRVVKRPGGSSLAMMALYKSPEHRSAEDTNLLEIMAQSLPGFEKYSFVMRRALGRVMNFSHFNNKSVILKQGHPAQSFYHILNGELEVRIVRPDGANIRVRVLRSGDSFGEIALLDAKQTRRTATVTAITDVDLLWFDRDDYDQILKGAIVKEMEERENYISKTPFFAAMGPEAVKALASTAEMLEVQADTTIFSEGDVSQFIMLICEGECKVLKLLDFAKVRVSHGGNTRFQLHPHPLSNAVDSSNGYAVVRKLAKIDKLEEQAHCGVTSAIITAGSPTQIATIGLLVNVRNTIWMPFSLVSASRLKYIAINRHTFCRELANFPELLERAAEEHLTFMEKYSNVRSMQISFIERRLWEMYKKEAVKSYIQDIRNKELDRKILHNVFQ